MNLLIFTSLFAKKEFHSRSNSYRIDSIELILLNAVSHHKYAIFLIFNTDKSIENYRKARTHLIESIRYEFDLSYFSLAKLQYEIFHSNLHEKEQQRMKNT